MRRTGDPKTPAGGAILPDGRLAPNSSNNSLFNPDFSTFDVLPENEYTLDPPGGVGHVYSVAGNTFRTVRVPFASGWSDNDLRLVFGAFTFLLAQGTTFDFTTYVPGGVTTFGLLDVHMLGLDPFLVDVSFTQAGRAFVVHQEVAPTVPEPTSVLLLASGLTLGVALRRRRRDRYRQPPE